MGGVGARGSKPKENLSSKVGELSPLQAKAPEMKGGDVARKEYERLAKELGKLGHLTNVNRQCLVNYCEAYALADMALQEVNDEGVTLESGETGNKYMHPALSAWSMARGTMEKEAKNLGMTPLSLQSLKNVKAPKKDEAPQGSRPSHYLK